MGQGCAGHLLFPATNPPAHTACSGSQHIHSAWVNTPGPGTRKGPAWGSTQQDPATLDPGAGNVAQTLQLPLPAARHGHVAQETLDWARLMCEPPNSALPRKLQQNLLGKVLLKKKNTIVQIRSFLTARKGSSTPSLPMLTKNGKKNKPQKVHPHEAQLNPSLPGGGVLL